MKPIREHINEKFTQNSDPIKDMGIGLFSDKNFKDLEEFYHFLATNLLGILGIPKMPNVLIVIEKEKASHACIKSIYDRRITNYIKKYVFVDNQKIQDYSISELGKKLLKLGKGVKMVTKKQFLADEYELDDVIGEDPILEKFIEDSDPIKDMNIGLKNQILNDLKEINIYENDISFEDDGTFFIKGEKNIPLESFTAIQEKYFPFPQKVLLHNLVHSKLPIKQLIDQARLDGLTFEQIDKIIKHTLKNMRFDNIRYNQVKHDLAEADIYIAKLKRTKEQEKEDEENNIYVFIGYTDKKPVIINGKKYYEDKFAVENMVKIDKFNVDQLAQINMMKLRLRFQNYPDGAVYMLKIPKKLMDKNNYYEIPDYLYDIVVKYKKKI